MDKTLVRLSEKIEVLREKLHRRAETMSLSHPDIMRLSRRLDKLIYKYQYYARNLKNTLKY
ncbi:hypothetical protein SCACP_01840 [Sporomusa carbonis]